MKIYLIHDPVRLDRRDLYRKELETQGIDFVTLVPAVKETSIAKVNIARAHKKCIRKAMEANLDRVVIMEDDVKFACPGAWNRFLELYKVMDGWNMPWDIFISGSYDYQPAPSLSIEITELTKFSGLHCYMVNKKFYEKFLALPETGHIDKSISKSGASIWMAYPMLALQHDTFSDNVKKITQYNKTYAHKIKLWKCSYEEEINNGNQDTAESV